MSSVMAIAASCIYLSLCAKFGVSTDIEALGFIIVWAGYIASLKD